MHVLPPTQLPAAVAQESEEGDTTCPPGLPGAGKHAHPLCWTLFEVGGGTGHSENGGETKHTLSIRGGGKVSSQTCVLSVFKNAAFFYGLRYREKDKKSRSTCKFLFYICLFY